MSSVFWGLNLVRLYSLYKILYLKRRIESYSILGTTILKILLMWASGVQRVPSESMGCASNESSFVSFVFAVLSKIIQGQLKPFLVVRIPVQRSILRFLVVRNPVQRSSRQIFEECSVLGKPGLLGISQGPANGTRSLNSTHINAHAAVAVASMRAGEGACTCWCFVGIKE